VEGTAFDPESDTLTGEVDFTPLLRLFEPTIPGKCQNSLYALIDPTVITPTPVNPANFHALVLKAKNADFRTCQAQMAHLFSIFANQNIPGAEWGGNFNSAMFVLPQNTPLENLFFTIFYNYEIQSINVVNAGPITVPPTPPTNFNVFVKTDAFVELATITLPAMPASPAELTFFNYSNEFGIVGETIRCIYDKLCKCRQRECSVPESVINTIGNLVCIERMRENLFRKCCRPVETCKPCGLGEKIRKYACCAASCLKVCSSPEMINCIEPCMKNGVIENSFSLFLAVNMVIGNCSSNSDKCPNAGSIETVYSGFYDFSFISDVCPGDLQTAFGLTDIQVDFIAKVSVSVEMAGGMGGDVVVLGEALEMSCSSESEEESSSTAEEKRKKKAAAKKAKRETEDKESFISRNKWPIAVGVVTVSVVIGISVYLVAM